MRSSWVNRDRRGQIPEFAFIGGFDDVADEPAVADDVDAAAQSLGGRAEISGTQRGTGRSGVPPGASVVRGWIAAGGDVRPMSALFRWEYRSKPSAPQKTVMPDRHWRAEKAVEFRRRQPAMITSQSVVSSALIACRRPPGRTRRRRSFLDQRVCLVDEQHPVGCRIDHLRRCLMAVLPRCWPTRSPQPSLDDLVRT